MFTYGSFFSGIDAPLYALGARAQSLFACEIDKFCCVTLRQNYAIQRVHEGDVNSVDIAALPAVDVFVAGFPCQPYSRAGHQRGNADSRAGLWVPCTHYIRQHRPRFVLLENVPQFRTTDKGATLQRLKQRIVDAGYAHVSDHVCNALDYGSCQNRKRLFIVAVRDEADAARFSMPVPVAQRQSFHELLEKDERPEHKFISQKRIDYLERRKERWTVPDPHPVESADIAPTLCASHSSNTWAHMIRMRDGRVREISAREALRLMGFGDEFCVDGVSRHRALQQAGNSIVVQMARAILDALLACAAVDPVADCVGAMVREHFSQCALRVVPECGTDRRLLHAVTKPRLGTAQGTSAAPNAPTNGEARRR